MRTSLVFACVCLAFASYAQKISVKGQLTDSTGTALPSATVMILSPKDSSLVNFGISNTQGFFEVKNLNRAEYLFRVTYVGYAPLIVKVTPKPDEAVVELGLLKMQPESRILDEVTIRAERAPVTVKKDTIEFNASSFKTKTNANVEDLLKTMPGIEVETDGTVRAQGEQVQRVTVDGREFFGRDPKLATRNLPADAIEKVQVFDRKSDQSQFTGIDDGQREKTINLELKEDKRNGAFGNLMAGAGTDSRFQASASINRFSKGQQLSFLGMGNNINEQGFSIGDFMNFSGGAQAMMSGGGARVTIGGSGGASGGPGINMGGRQSGIMTNYAGGINFNKDLSKDTKITSSYFYNHLDRNVNSSLLRINSLPDIGNYNFTQTSRQVSTSDNHRGTLVLDHTIDSANVIRATANASYTNSEFRSFNESQTMNIGNTEVRNESERSIYTEQTGINLNANVLWRHRFNKKGRNVTTTLTVGLNSNESEGNQQSVNIYNTQGTEEQIDQTNTQETMNQTYGVAISYTEPLGGRKYIEANYNFSTNQNDVDRSVFDWNLGTPEFNTTLSNKFKSNYIYNRPGINFRMNKEKYSLTVGASYQMTNLKGELLLHDVMINRTFKNLLPVARFNYDFSSVKHLRLDYETNMQEPGVQQLQPIVDNSDPLNISVGNPDLKPAYVHRVTANYTAFNPVKFMNLFAFVNASYINNAITNSQSVNDSLVRTTKPVNVDRAMSLSANINAGFPISKLKSRFNIGPTASLSESINILNEQENNVRQQTVGGTARYNFTFKDILILDLSATLSNQKVKYDFATPDQEYFNQTYRGELNLNFLKKYAYNTGFDYLIYTSTTTDFKETIPFWNMSVSRFILKNNAGEIKIGVNNILDQSNNVTQSAGENFVQQQTMNNLGRFYMVSFTYALNKHLNPMGGGRRGGMRMMIRQ
ncbi:MAG: outer membrane beta-barrel protein [Cyclobacteriaceae bacterium]|nr:outer membrane beta-barrel protein [Cyclobacteriaceae bacterium]